MARKKLSLVEQFQQFHAENPHVYDLFKRFAFELKIQGWNRFPAEPIMERVRWETVGTSWYAAKSYRWIGDEYVGLYAMKLADEESAFRNFFHEKERGTR